MTLRNTKDSFYHARAADTYLYVCLFIKTGGGVGLKKFVTPTHVEDLPDAPELNRLYLVGSEAQPWSAALLCPCGCCSLIQLSLIGGDDPRWTLSYDVNRSVTCTLRFGGSKAAVAISLYEQMRSFGPGAAVASATRPRHKDSQMDACWIGPLADEPEGQSTCRTGADTKLTAVPGPIPETRN